MSERQNRSPNVAKTTAPKHRSWFEHRNAGKKILIALGVVCTLLVLADLGYHKHVHFKFEENIGFHGLFGFFAYVAIVNSAKLLRLVVKRPEDYYNE